MRILIAVLAVGVVLSAPYGSTALAEADQAGSVFKLQREPLPVSRAGEVPMKGYGISPITEMPPGIDAVEAMGTKVKLGMAGLDRLWVVLAKSSRKQKRHDRLYVDTNGDGRFERAECYDITRTKKPVRVLRSERQYHYVEVTPIKLVGKQGASPYWIGLLTYQYERGAYIRCGSVTCATGKVRFGDKDLRLAIYEPSLSGRFDRGIDLPGEEAGGMGSCCQLLLDANGNGQFDRLNLRDMGFENRWLTRLVRIGGTYYELKVAADGGSIRITPSKPKVGTLKIPEHVGSASVIGPAFATIVTSKDKQLELPAGTYAVHRYEYRRGSDTLHAAGLKEEGQFEIKAGQTASFRAGAPLRLGVICRSDAPNTQGSRNLAPKNVRISMALEDCAGRRVQDLRTGTGRPPAPRLKIVGPTGKTVLDAAFKYG